MRLITLGRLALLDQSGIEQSLVGHKRDLVLLAVLATADGPFKRDEVGEMFWSAQTDRRARRHSLSNALSYLRGVVGHDVITTYRSEVLLRHDAFEVDSVELLDAARDRDFATVVDLYRGQFLHGIVLGGSGSLERWAAGKRALLARAVRRAAEIRCVATASSRDWIQCARAARRWLDVEPTSSDAALHLLNALRADGTPDGRTTALGEYDRLRKRLAQDHDCTPDERVVELARRIEIAVARAQAEGFRASPDFLPGPTSAPRTSGATGSITGDAILTAAATAAHADDAAQAPLAPRVETHRRPQSTTDLRGALRSRRTAAVATMVTLIIAGAAVRAWPSRVTAAARPLVAVTDVGDLQHDTASAWLDGGFAQMIASDLAREPDVEVVAPGRVRDTRTRASLPLDGALTADRGLDIARRLGATLAVRGAFTHGNGTFVLDISVRDVASGRTLHSFGVSGSDPAALAADAATRILDGGSSVARVNFTDIETPNMAAYRHFIAALHAADEGRHADEARELDAAIALDSAFGSAILMRRAIGPGEGASPAGAQLEEKLRHARLTPWDVQTNAIESALHRGENGRSELLARALVQRYPHDPRAYDALASSLEARGDWHGFESTYQHVLGLDSLAMEAGTGPCAPCAAYEALARVRVDLGNLVGAQQAAQRWVDLQPDLPRAWTALAGTLEYGGRYQAAIQAQRRAIMLSGNDPFYQQRLARLLISARRLGEADSLAHAGRVQPGSSYSVNDARVDVHVLVERERGQLSASVRDIEANAAIGDDETLRLEEMDALGRLGEYAAVGKLFREHVASGSGARNAAGGLAGDRARWFCWTRALEANALAGSGDTLRLKSLADSIRSMSALSYYGRDKRLYHHVLGLIAMKGKRYAEAEREFAAARWGLAGWTATVAWLARAQLALNRPVDAIATLRQAYEGPLDAMGRYEPHSELDNLMAAAFVHAGQRDSAAVYAEYARHAWHSADPEVVRRNFSSPPTAILAFAHPASHQLIRLAFSARSIRERAVVFHQGTVRLRPSAFPAATKHRN